MFEEEVDARQMSGEENCIYFDPNMTLVLNEISGSQSGEHEGYVRFEVSTAVTIMIIIMKVMASWDVIL
jgi:hypothetical protein